MQKPVKKVATDHLNCLGLKAYWDAIGDTLMMRVLEEAGLTLRHFRKYAYYTSPCTPKMFHRIETAAKKITPGILPDYEICTSKVVRQAVLEARKNAENVTQKAERQYAAMRAAQRATTTASHPGEPS